MPVRLGERNTLGCSGDRPWPIVNVATGEAEGCSGPTRDDAMKAVQARNMAHAGLLRGESAARLKEWHDLLAAEMRRRGMHHRTPLGVAKAGRGEKPEAGLIEGDADTIAKAFEARILKADATRHIVYGVVMEPASEDEIETWVAAGKPNPPPKGVDSEGDWTYPLDIEEAAHGFMRAYRKGVAIKLEHRGKPIEANVVESYLAPEAVKLGEETIRAGSWVMGTHLPREQDWALVEKGELTGYSIGGRGHRV